MKTWGLLLLAAVAAGAVTVAVVASRRGGEELEEIPKLIDDCFDRIHRIERELNRLRHSPEPAA